MLDMAGCREHVMLDRLKQAHMVVDVVFPAQDSPSGSHSFQAPSSIFAGPGFFFSVSIGRLNPQ